MKGKKTALWTIVLLLLSAAFFAWLLRGADLAGIRSAVRQARMHWLVAGVTLVALFLLCQAAALRMLLRRCGQHIGLLSSLRAALTGFYFSGITPSASGGQPAQVWQLSRLGIPPGASAGALLLMQIAYQAVMIVLGIAGFLLCGGLIAGTHGGIRALLLYGFFAAAVVFALLLGALVSGRRFEHAIAACIRCALLRRLIRNPDALCERLHRQIEQFNACAALFARSGRLSVQLLLITLVQQLCILSVPCAVYCAFGLTGQPLWRLVAAQAMLSIAVDTLPLPGAVGASESAFVAVQGLFFGPLALPAMLLSRGLSFYLTMAVAGVVTAMPLPHHSDAHA